MWRELRTTHFYTATADAATGRQVDFDGAVGTDTPKKTFGQAIWQIIVADVSMSLDNVLAVAGASRNHPYILVFGLMLSIALMGIAANFMAHLLQKHRWIAYVGLAIILYVALDMCHRGTREVWPYAERIANLL
jgi:YjbE family integral membrane protein